MLNLNAIGDAQVFTQPFPFMAAAEVLNPWDLKQIARDFPAIDKPGVFPLSELRYGGAFGRLIEDVDSRDLEALLERKFDMALADKPLMITVRGRCQERDGRIHTDSRDKVLTCLLYLNEGGWDAEGGRLRLLLDPRNLDSQVAEIPPLGGNFVAFRRTDNSWHGHAPFEGPRRCIMFNWMRSEAARAVNLGRHRISAAFKGAGRSYGL